jgi:hypothetical protein
MKSIFEDPADEHLVKDTLHFGGDNTSKITNATKDRAFISPSPSKRDSFADIYEV